MGISLVLERKTTPSAAAPRHQEQDMEYWRSSPRTGFSKTGNVVARLMGLDQIPEPTPSRSSDGYSSQEQLSSLRVATFHKQRRETAAVTPPPLRHPLRPRNCDFLVAPPEDARHGTRSLPDTPRMSSARKSWDADPRLSLQLSFKENVAFALGEGNASFLSPSSLSAKSKRRISRLQQDENRSPRQYASDIMKQVKESVTRRIAGRSFEDPPAGSTGQKTKAFCHENGRQICSSTAPPSCSPRLRALDSPKNKPASPAPPPPPPPLPLCRPSSPHPQRMDREVAKAASGKSRKPRSEWFMEKMRKSPAVAAREESFLSPPSSPQPRKKCRSSSPAFVPGIRKEALTFTSLSPPPSPSPSQQTSAPAAPRLRHTRGQLRISDDGDSRARRSSNSSVLGPEEYLYVRCVLGRTGVQSHTPLSSAAARWYSPSHPVDPIVFHQLERSFNRSSGSLRQRCNRKLLFHLVDEVLAELLWQPREPWRRRITDGESLMQSVWSRIRNFSAASCRAAPPDVDALVEADLPAVNVRRLLLHPAVSQEAESVAVELGTSILDSLVAEAAAALLTPSQSRIGSAHEGQRLT
ncbi:unnamed protein product [Spirodela intermedia]|uniref:Uncharacterized protein n=1 Tax=Spirodela intermedia TaxID=51605 RepID=A0A7I8KGC7_SPIIN|nr:unnamed protein product [Spirodela intermedia]